MRFRTDEQRAAEGSLLCQKALEVKAAAAQAAGVLPMALNGVGRPVHPMPVPLEGARRLACVLYHRCFDLAQAQGWGQHWSCRRCLGPFADLVPSDQVTKLPTDQPTNRPEEEEDMSDHKTPMRAVAKETGAAVSTVARVATRLRVDWPKRTPEQHERILAEVGERAGRRGGRAKRVPKIEAAEPARKAKRAPRPAPRSDDHDLAHRLLVAVFPDGIGVEDYGRAAAIVRALVLG